MRFWPRGLAARTAVVVIAGLVLVQAAGLTIHAMDRVEVQQLAQARDTAERVTSLYRTIVMTSPAQRPAALASVPVPPGLTAEIGPQPSGLDLPEAPLPVQRLFRVNMAMMPLGGPHTRWREMSMRGGPAAHRAVIAMRLPEGEWLNVSVALRQAVPWHSPTFLAAFLIMTVAAAVLTIWAARRLTAPVRTLAAAAEALGRDVNAPPLPENGPLEVAAAAAAFNTMAARLRRFIQDRTELLTAIGHDLRTPITRLKLRAEFVGDEEQRGKILADLAELEALVSATLAFGRDARTDEPVGPLDLAELIRTILDELTDTNLDIAERLRYEGPAHLTVRARSLGLKRALGNLIGNAATHGGSALARLNAPDGGMIRIEIEDEGSGIPPAELDRVFEPFYRLEASRNRETGGVGLGLSIARNILRAHGGDVTIMNRAEGGARAVVLLPG